METVNRAAAALVMVKDADEDRDSVEGGEKSWK